MSLHEVQADKSLFASFSSEKEDSSFLPRRRGMVLRGHHGI
jgi:hypothetical protein